MTEERVKAWAVVCDFRNGAISEEVDSHLGIYMHEGIAKAVCLDGERVVPVVIEIEAADALDAKDERIREFERELTAAQEARQAAEERAEANAGLLKRCRTILGNMAQENEGAIFNRWPISHEPLRADAKNLVPLLDAAIAGEKL